MRPAEDPWGLWLAAPKSEADLPRAYEELSTAVRGRPLLVAVHAGTSLTRAMLAEQARLIHGVPALVVEDDMNAERAETLLLSGRADLVGSARPPAR